MLMDILVSSGLPGFVEGCLDQIKGFTRSSVIMTVLLAASEVDVNSEEGWDMLQPLVPFLDKAWMVHVVASRRTTSHAAS